MYIKEVLVKNFWRRGDMLWRLDEDVNVLVGANGSGKSTILNLIYEALQPKISEEAREKYFSLVGDVVIELSDEKFIFVDSSNERFSSKIQEPKLNLLKIRTFDIQNSLDELISEERLAFEIYMNHTRKKLEEIYLTQKQVPRDDEEILKSIDRRKLFIKIINQLFAETGKSFSEDNFSFKLEKQKLELTHKELSSGEKQIFYILLKVLVQDGKPSILLMDEPEVSLHIEWQRELINFIRQLNEKCQVIIVTHSSSIFYAGWSDKMQRITDIQKEAQNAILKKIDPHYAEYDMSDFFKSLKKLSKISLSEVNNMIQQSFFSITLDYSQKILNYITKELTLNPDHYTFTILISKAKNLKDAFKLYQMMKERQILPNGVTYLNLMKKASNLQDAINIFDQMRNDKIEPAIQHFSTLLGKVNTPEQVQMVEDLRALYGISTNEIYANKLRVKA